MKGGIIAGKGSSRVEMSVCTRDCRPAVFDRVSVGKPGGVDRSEGKGGSRPCLPTDLFLLHKTVGSHCVFLRESVMCKQSARSTLEPAFSIIDKMAPESRWLGHLGPCELALRVRRPGHLPGPALVFCIPKSSWSVMIRVFH